MSKLKNRLGTGVFKWDGDEIALQTNLSNLKALQQDVGVDALVFLQTAESPADLAKLFYHLQEGSEHSEADIFAAFFGSVKDMGTDEWQTMLGAVLADMLGADKAAMIPPAKDTQKKD